MKKVFIFAAIMMMMVFVASAQAEVRAGGLPELQVDNNIKSCDCRLFPECCAQPAPEPVPVIKEKVMIELNIEFDTDKAIVKDKYYDEIKKVADFMKEFPGTSAVIEGHTDNVGKEAYNQKLSEKRANSVRQYLIDKFGVDASRVSAVGYGMSKPIAGNDTNEGRQKNRRVVAVMEAERIR